MASIGVSIIWMRRGCNRRDDFLNIYRSRGQENTNLDGVKDEENCVRGEPEDIRIGLHSSGNPVPPLLVHTALFFA